MALPAVRLPTNCLLRCDTREPGLAETHIAIAEENVRLGPHIKCGDGSEGPIDGRRAVAPLERSGAVAQRPVGQIHARRRQREQRAASDDRQLQRPSQSVTSHAGTGLTRRRAPRQRKTTGGEEPERHRGHLPHPVDTRRRSPCDAGAEHRRAEHTVRPAGAREKTEQYRADGRHDEDGPMSPSSPSTSA